MKWQIIFNHVQAVDRGIATDQDVGLGNTLDRTVYDLLKGLAGVKRISMSELVAEALDRFIEDADNKELIEYHRLEGREGD